MSGAATKPHRSRMPPEARRAQILATATRLVLAQGYLPLPLEAVAKEAGVSKALVYNYFPTQHDLFNAILAGEFARLEERGLPTAAQLRPLEAAAVACGLAYFDHVAERGPVIHVILRDHFMDRRLEPAVAVQRDRVIRALARAARTELRLRAKENIAAINLAITIPEETGRLAYAGELAPDRARTLCEQLVRSSLSALRPRPEAP
jgi:AcrR family transcriptional regulator